MPLIILKCENQLEKVCRIYADFTKMVRGICKLHVHAEFSIIFGAEF